MDLLDMSVTTSRGNRYVFVIVDCFTRWTEAFPLPDKTAQSVADALFNQVFCRFGMPAVIHSDQGREFENKILQELCLLGGSHKTKTTPYHPESDGMVERFNRTLLMMLAMFAGKNRDDWDDLLPAVMMAYRSSVHESTGFSPYRLMFGEECTLPMDIEQQNNYNHRRKLRALMPYGSMTRWRRLTSRFDYIPVRWCSDRSAYMTAGPSNVIFQWVNGSCDTMHQQRSVNWIRHGLGHI